MKLQKACAVIWIGVVLLAASDAMTYAATGSSLIMGRINQATSATTIQNTGTGSALRLITQATTTPPMVVNGKGKVVNLYADRAASADNAAKLGGQTAAQIVSSVPRPAGVIWVAKSGGQFTTVSAALASITDNGPAHPYVIKVAPGRYTEVAPVAMKDHVDVEGAGQAITTITCHCGSNVLNAVFTFTAVHAGIRHLTVANTGSNLYDSTGVLTRDTGPGDVSLDDLTVTATGATNIVHGIFNHTSSPNMTNVTAMATGGIISWGILDDWSSPTMTNVTATATGTEGSVGIFNADSSSPSMTNVTAHATTTVGASVGVSNSASSSPTMTNVTATATGGSDGRGVLNGNLSIPTMTNVTATATGATTSYGVYNDSSSPTMTDVTATATGVTASYGIYDVSSSPTMTGGRADGSGASKWNTGIVNTSGSSTFDSVTATGTGGISAHGIDTSGGSMSLVNVTASGAGGSSGDDRGINNTSSTITIRDSFITGSPHSIVNFDGIVHVANSRLSAPGSGTITCIGSYNPDFVALDATCQ